MSTPVAGPILIVEDDEKTTSLIRLYLEREGYETVSVGDGVEALRLAQELGPALIVLDLMLPRLDGLEVCRKLRELSGVPILMLTARGEEVDRVLGFMIGADDYVVKPFSPRELVVRIKAILRRARSVTADQPEVLRHGDLTLDLRKHELSVRGSPVDLTPSEFKLLQLLMSSQGRLYTRDQLLGALYPGGEEVVDRVIDVHIGKLRQKIEPDPANPRRILTVRGYGYRFAETGADSPHREEAS